MAQKIGIITMLNLIPNFGNRLQNYAVQRIVETLGYEPETIIDCRWVENPLRLWSYRKHIFHIVTRWRYLPRHRKALRFRRWTLKYMHHCPIVIRTDADFAKIADRYTYLFVGSDQVWNPLYCPDQFWLGAFDTNATRIAISPSFGVDNIPEDKREEYKNSLCKYDALSAREGRGAEIITELIGTDVPVLPDPTMVLTAKEWNEIAVPPSCQDYVLYYHLGEDVDIYHKYVYDLAASLSVRVIDLSCREYGAADPGEFVGLIKNANHIVTDSFHGAVFSLLYEKSLTIVNRQDQQGVMNSRLFTLLDKMEIKYDGRPIFEVDKVIDHNQINDRIDFERKRFWEYLQKNVK